MSAHPGRRLFRRRGKRIGLLHVMAGLAALAACTPRTEIWSPAESPKHIRVTWAEFHHTVVFAAGSGVLATDQRAALDRFLDRLAAGEGVRIAVAAADPGDPGLALRREAAVMAHLRGRGLRPELATAPARSRGDAVDITIGRHVATPPACPDWSKPATDDIANRVSSNFGCATAVNLGLMVADPGSLVHGRPLGPGDGESLADSVRSHRQGRTPWLPPAATSGTAAGAGSGGVP